MKYADFIKGNEGFQYSINIQYDLMNPNKIKGYIPTRNSIEILKEYLLNVLIDERDKSTVLIGPYGKGKSHLLLILLGLMCGSNNIKELNLLIEKIKLIDSNCARIASDVLNNKKFLPIVINFNSGDLNQAFLIALNHALKNEKIKDIFPETYFDSALSVLEGWEGYKNTIRIVKNFIKEEYNLELDVFKRRLKAFDIETYEMFKRLFSKITSGIEFNPLINTDVVKLYEETNHVLKEKYNYDGMIIVFDEFSKFIEMSTDLNSSMNLKILQDFAELSSRTKSPQMHLVCITHKTINEYISKIPQEKINAWRAIEGRFKEILFNTSSQQNYELISNAIVKDLNKVKSILYDKGLDTDYKIWSAQGLFNYNDKEYREQIIEGCFPLSPYSTYTLPIISEKVAQNERTLFTYLSKDEPNSLIDLVNNDEKDFYLVTIDKIYDYFETLFRKETFNKAIHDIWIKTDTALKIVFSEEEKKIIKALCIIYIVNDFNLLPPTEQVIYNILDIDKERLDEIIKNLRNLNILVLRKSNETLDFIPLSSVDIHGKINSLKETKFKANNIADTYNNLVNLKYILPKKYNDEYKMTRFFKRTFMTKDHINAYLNAETLLKDYSCDGLIIDLIPQEESDKEEALTWIEKINDNRIILVIPKEIIKIKEDIAEYKAIEFLKSDDEFLKEDVAIESQLDILFDDIIQKITKYINYTYDLSSNKSIVYINFQKYEMLKALKLSSILSDICKDHFANAPIINNELVNKQEISYQIKKARNLIVEMILNNSYCNFDWNKNAPECSLFRSTILNKGLLNSQKEYSEDIKRLLIEIKEFILSANEKEINFEILYKSLITNQKKIGIRKGVLPIYLSFVLKDYKDEAIVYLKSGRSKKELVLDANVIDNINLNPSSYLIKVEKGTKEKDEYIEILLGMFNKYLNKTSNNRYVDIINGMKSWIQSLSLFTQNHKINIENDEEISKEINKLRSELVKYEINYRSFIFNDLLKYLSVKNYNNCIDKLKKIKEYLDSHDDKVREFLIKESNYMLDKNYTGSLKGNLNKWYIGLTEDQKSHLFNKETNEFLRLIQNSGNNDVELINRLAYNFSNLAIEDWNDNTINVYLDGIRNSIKAVEEYEAIGTTDESEGLIKIVFKNSGSTHVEKTFNKTEITPLGGTLFNAIEELVDEYGDSVSDNEKRNILMNILSKYI